MWTIRHVHLRQQVTFPNPRSAAAYVRLHGGLGRWRIDRARPSWPPRGGLR